MAKNTKNTDADSENASLQNALSFEAALSELEVLVEQMESDQMPLEQSLAAYKRGTDLLRFCQKNLSDVEQQVRILDSKNQLQAYTDDKE